MNGNEIVQKLSVKIACVVTKIELFTKNSDERHQENKERSKTIFAKLDALPCKAAQADLVWLKWSVKILWGVLIIGGIVKGLAFAGVIR